MRERWRLFCCGCPSEDILKGNEESEIIDRYINRTFRALVFDIVITNIGICIYIRILGPGIYMCRTTKRIISFMKLFINGLKERERERERELQYFGSKQHFSSQLLL